MTTRHPDTAETEIRGILAATKNRAQIDDLLQRLRTQHLAERALAVSWSEWDETVPPRDRILRDVQELTRIADPEHNARRTARTSTDLDAYAAHVRDETLADVRRAARRLTVGLIAVSHLLDKPYTDDARSPWTLIVQPALRSLRNALDGLSAPSHGDQRASEALAAVLAEVEAERDRQDLKFGEQNHRDGTGLPVYQGSARRHRDHAQRAAASGHLAWRDVLQEEVYEALAEKDPAALRGELVQVAAVAVAWIQAIDRRTTEPASLTEAAVSPRSQDLRPNLIRELLAGAQASTPAHSTGDPK